MCCSDPRFWTTIDDFRVATGVHAFRPASHTVLSALCCSMPVAMGRALAGKEVDLTNSTGDV